MSSFTGKLHTTMVEKSDGQADHHHRHNHHHHHQYGIITTIINTVISSSTGTLYITMAEMSDGRDTYACAMQSDQLRSIKVADVPYIKLRVTPSTGTDDPL